MARFFLISGRLSLIIFFYLGDNWKKNPDDSDSFVVIFSQTHAEEKRTRRNSNVLKMAIAIVLAFFSLLDPLRR